MPNRNSPLPPPTATMTKTKTNVPTVTLVGIAVLTAALLMGLFTANAALGLLSLKTAPGGSTGWNAIRVWVDDYPCSDNRYDISANIGSSKVTCNPLESPSQCECYIKDSRQQFRGFTKLTFSHWSDEYSTCQWFGKNVGQDGCSDAWGWDTKNIHFERVFIPNMCSSDEICKSRADNNQVVKVDWQCRSAICDWDLTCKYPPEPDRTDCGVCKVCYSGSCGKDPLIPECECEETKDCVPSLLEGWVYVCEKYRCNLKEGVSGKCVFPDFYGNKFVAKSDLPAGSIAVARQRCDSITEESICLKSYVTRNGNYGVEWYRCDWEVGQETIVE